MEAASINDLCTEERPENRFDAWCRKRLYPALAVVNDMELRTDRGMYKKRIDELCSGKPENEFDVWLRERFYPIVAMMMLSTRVSL